MLLRICIRTNGINAAFNRVVPLDSGAATTDLDRGNNFFPTFPEEKIDTVRYPRSLILRQLRSPPASRATRPIPSEIYYHRIFSHFFLLPFCSLLLKIRRELRSPRGEINNFLFFSKHERNRGEEKSFSRARVFLRHEE